MFCLSVNQSPPLHFSIMDSAAAVYTYANSLKLDPQVILQHANQQNSCKINQQNSFLPFLSGVAASLFVCLFNFLNKRSFQSFSQNCFVRSPSHTLVGSSRLFLDAVCFVCSSWAKEKLGFHQSCVGEFQQWFHLLHIQKVRTVWVKCTQRLNQLAVQFAKSSVHFHNDAVQCAEEEPLALCLTSTVLLAYCALHNVLLQVSRDLVHSLTWRRSCCFWCVMWAARGLKLKDTPEFLCAIQHTFHILHSSVEVCFFIL